MRQIREVLRLRFVCERSQREIATTIGASSATVWDYLDRARRAQLDFGKAMSLDDAALEALLFPPPPPLSRTRPLPNWALVHRELGRRGVTLDLPWNEYKAQEPEGYGYDWFCKHYERWAAALPVTLRQSHTPGEKLFIDHSGNRPGIVDPHTPARSARRNCSSRRSAHRTTPMPRSPGPSSLRTGSVRMCAH
ncbi:transposase [Paraburkholderia sp. JPY465]